MQPTKVAWAGKNHAARSRVDTPLLEIRGNIAMQPMDERSCVFLYLNARVSSLVGGVYGYDVEFI